MYKILVASHSELSKGLLEAAKMILGDIDGVDHIVLDENGIEVFSEKLNEKISSLKNKNCEVLVLTDIFGGTPFNQSMIKSQQYEKVRVISGVNLAMVIEAIMNRTNNLDEAVEDIISSAKESIVAGVINNQKHESVCE